MPHGSVFSEQHVVRQPRRLGTAASMPLPIMFGCTNECPLPIGERGFPVLPITALRRNHAALAERLSTEIARLDEVLGRRGVFCGSSMPVPGAAGPGKNSSRVKFAEAACHFGPRARFFAAEESSADGAQTCAPSASISRRRQVANRAHPARARSAGNDMLTPFPAQQVAAAMTRTTSPEEQLRAENAELRARLEKAEQTLHAIRSGGMEALIVETADGPRAFTLQGLDAESKRLHGESLAQVGDAVIAVNLEQCVTYLNAAAERLYRISAGDVLGRQLSQIFSRHWPSAESEDAAWVALREHGDWRGELTHRTHDGRELQVEAWLTRFRDADGADAGVVTAIRDITERKQAQTKLAEATRRFEFALRIAPLTLFQQDSDLRYTWIYNPALGYNSELVIGKRDGDLLERAQDAANTEAMKREVMRTGVSERRDMLIHAQGVDRFYDLLVEPLMDQLGSITGVTCAAIEITERKRSTVELQRVGELLDTLLRTAPIGLCFLDRDLRYLRINERLAEINGVSSAAHLGRHISEVVPNIQGTVRDVTDRILATGQAVLNREFSGETPAAPGVTRFWNESWYPVRDGAGEILGFGAVVEEITARKQAEDALRESHQFTRRVLDNNLAAFVGVTTPDGTVTYANRAPLEAAGIPASEVLGKKFWDCHWWSYSPEIQAQLRQACERAASGEVVRYDVPVRMAGDTLMWIDFQVAPLRDAEGLITHLIPSAMDIAVRRAAVENLRASEERTRLATEATAVGIWERNIHTHTLRWDAQMFHLYGLSPTADGFVQYSDWSGAVLPEDLPENERILQDTARRGGQSRREFRIRRYDDGALRHIESVETVRANARGEIEWLVGTNLDVTERKTAEIQLRQLAANLSDADRRKDEFLATLAHELRNPLAPIRIGLNVLQRSQDLAQIVRTQAMMSRQLGHMVKLIDDLMDVSRINSGKVILRHERVSLRAVVENAVEASGSLMEAAQHVLHIDLPGEPIWLDVDATRICQVFSNLLSNAAKYSPDQSSISLSGRQEGQDVVVCVVDPGVGIPADMLDHVFEMFAQVNRTLDRAQGGLGIGLALAKRLVEMHGGTVAATSAGTDQGSTFTVRLPAAVLIHDVAASFSPDGFKAARHDQLSVLIVDDNPDAAESLAALFQLLGHETAVANSGPVGLELASRATPDVVFLDLSMPGMSGYEVARRLRPMPGFAATTLVALSGWGSDEDRRKSKEAGFDRHFVKPADYEEIEALLDQLGRKLGRIESGQTSS